MKYCNCCKVKYPLVALMESIKVAVVITETDDIPISVNFCNSVGAIEAGSQILDYVNCTNVARVPNGYDNYRTNDYEIYNLYRYNPVCNADSLYMTIAVK